MQKPTFSICIPNFNYEDYVGETIQSVLDQTYPHFEIIVADNASTDNSVAVVESFKDDRIRLVRNRYNIGFAPNLQRATMHATGDFINLLSSDDRMKSDALEVYAKVLQRQGEQARQTILMSDVDVIDSKSRPVEDQPGPKDRFQVTPSQVTEKDGLTYSVYHGRDVLADTLRRLRTFAPFLSIVYPRAMWEAVEGYNSVRTIGPDKHFNYKLLSLNPDVVYVHQKLFEYRVHGSPNQQAQRQTLKQQIDDYLYTLEFSDSFLEACGVTRQELIDVLLDRVCLKTGLTQLVYGSYKHAVQMLAFSMAAYPKETLKKPRAYALAGLLLLGPLARFPARLLYKLYRKKTL